VSCSTTVARRCWRIVEASAACIRCGCSILPVYARTGGMRRLRFRPDRSDSDAAAARVENAKLLPYASSSAALATRLPVRSTFPAFCSISAQRSLTSGSTRERLAMRALHRFRDRRRYEAAQGSHGRRAALARARPLAHGCNRNCAIEETFREWWSREQARDEISRGRVRQ